MHMDNVQQTRQPAETGAAFPEDRDSPPSEQHTDQAVISLSPEDIRQARRVLELLTMEAPPSGANGNAITTEYGTRDLCALASLTLQLRQRRQTHFSASMFGEPAWDLLLALYVTQTDAEVASVSTLAKTAEIPMSTASRWLDYLEEHGFVERQPSHLDGRASNVFLSPRGRAALGQYLADMLTNFGAIAKRIGTTGRCDIDAAS